MHTNARKFITTFDNGVDNLFFFGQRCGCGTRCKGEGGIVVVFEVPLRMAKGDTSGCWCEYGAQARVRPCLAGVEAFLQPNANPTPQLKAQRRNRRFVLTWMLTPSTVSNQLILHSPLHNDLSWIPGHELDAAMMDRSSRSVQGMSILVGFTLG